MRFAEVKSVEQQSVFNRDLVSEHEGEGYLCRINRPDTWARRPPSVMRDFPCQQGVYRSTRITLTPMIQQHVTMVAIILNGLRFAMTARDV
jgi:hypothetical protein